MQLTLFELSDFRKPVLQEPVTCGFCGETSPNQFLHELNHGDMEGLCKQARLLSWHCVTLARGARRNNCYAESCKKHHPGEWSSKPLPECARLELEEKTAWLKARGIKP